jgi:hypothetical protein
MSFPTRVVLLLALLACTCFFTVAQDAPPPPAPPAPSAPATAAQPLPTDKSADQSKDDQSKDDKSKDAQGKDDPTKPDPTKDAQSKDDKKKPDPSLSGGGKVEGTSNDRLFYTLPNFLTLQNKDKLPPLSVKDKFKVVALGTFDPVEFPWWGILAAISQSNNDEPALGQGWGSYAKRFGITAGDSLVENFMVGAVFPSVLHQDPRYYQSGRGGFFRRTGYSVSRIFVTRSDSGHRRFNFSEVFGAGTAAAISTYTYHPKSTYLSIPRNPHLFVASDRTFDNTIDTWGTQLTLDTITLVIKEFWPDIHRKMAHKHAQAAPLQPGATDGLGK